MSEAILRKYIPKACIVRVSVFLFSVFHRGFMNE